jgi:membrane protein
VAIPGGWADRTRLAIPAGGIAGGHGWYLASVVKQRDERGRQADSPASIPPPGWKDIVVRAKEEAKTDDVSLLGGGVAFFAMLALVPALVAVVSIYGVFANESTVVRQVGDVLGAAPREVQDLVTAQLRSIVMGSRAGLSIAAVAGILLALWSASAGMKHLIGAINVAYDENETRGFIKVRAISLALTVAAIVFLVVAFGIIAVLPAALAKTGLGDAGRIAVGVVRWVVLLVGMMVGVAVLYRYGPDREDPKWSWASPGAIFATVTWIAVSLLFSLYTANFGNYNKTYGTLAGIVVVMLWLYLTAVAIIVGAELNAEIERQTERDSTEGPEQPMGSRGAFAADTVGPTADELHGQRSSVPR